MSSLLFLSAEAVDQFRDCLFKNCHRNPHIFCWARHLKHCFMNVGIESCNSVSSKDIRCDLNAITIDICTGGRAMRANLPLTNIKE